MNPPPTSDQKKMLHQARRAKLAQIWVSGSRRLSSEEKAEIADIIGGEPPPPAPEPSLPEPGFTLRDGAPLPRKLRGFYKLAYRDYAPIYQLSAKHGERTIKRWVSIGRHAAPPEPPPLDDPPAMAAWWRRHSTERPPPVLLDYETAAPTSSAPSQEAPPQPPSASAPPPPEAPTANRMTASVNLAELGLEEGELVQQMRAIVKGNYAQVDAALKAEDQDAYRRWFPIYTDSAEALRKLEKEYRESAKASGAMLSRSQVISELAQLLEALRLMREAMPQKILAELSKRAEGRRRRVLRMIEPDLVTAILAVRAREADILTTIDLLRSPAAARETFALEAA